MSVSVGRARLVGTGFKDKETGHFRLFAGAVVGLDLLVLAIAGMHSREALRDPIQVLAWTLLVTMAGLVPLRSGRGSWLAMDLPLLLGAAFTFEPFTAGLIALTGAADIRELRGEISLLRGLWNRAQTSLSVMAASLTFLSLGALSRWPWAPVVALVALGSDAIVNYLLVGLGTSLRTGVGLPGALRGMRIGSPRTFILTYACFGFLGLLIAEAYAAFSLTGVVASMAPVLLGSQAFANRLHLDQAEQDLAARSDALRNVDERIADERRDERVRIAEALHDEVLQDLYNVTIRAQVLRQDLLAGRLLDLEDDLPPVIRASEAAVEDLRDVIRGLRSATIGHAGLVETLSLFARHVEQESKTRTVLLLDPTVRSSPERELVIYQIAREALNNCIRHAGAKTVWISLRQAEDINSCELLVEDDGKGFDPYSSLSDRHFGLQLMKERAKSISGELAIRSSLGAGTVVSLVFKP